MVLKLIIFLNLDLDASLSDVIDQGVFPNKILGMETDWFQAPFRINAS